MFRTLIAVAAAVALGRSACAAGSLVGHWKFNEAPGSPTAADSGPGGFTGTLHGNAAFVTGGREGNAISVATANPGGYVEMLPIPFNTTPYSLALWIKTPTPDYCIIAGKHIGTLVAGYFLGLNRGGNYGSPGKAHSYQSTLPGGEPISVTTVNDNQWRHLVMTHSPGGQVTIYVDGKLEATKPAPNYVPSTAPFIVGAIVNTSGQRVPLYTGLVDDVHLYSGVLTGPQLCAIFNNPGSAAPIACNGDVNLDRNVNFPDLNIVLSNFGQTGMCLPGDADGDGSVTFADLNLVLSNFGSSC